MGLWLAQRKILMNALDNGAWNEGREKPKDAGMLLPEGLDKR